MKQKSESGRTMSEMLAVLAIVGILSISSLMGFQYMMNKHKINEIIHAVNLANVQILTRLAQQKMESPQEMNDFLSGFKTSVSEYNVTFKAPRDSDQNFTGTEYVAEITDGKGKRIKGAMCRQIITSMMQLQDVSDIDFSINDEEMEDGSTESIVAMRLSGKAVDLTALCGKDVF